MALLDLLMGWFAEPGYNECAVVNTVTDTRVDPAIAAIARRHLSRYRALLSEFLIAANVTDSERITRKLLLLIEGASIDPSAAAGGRMS